MAGLLEWWVAALMSAAVSQATLTLLEGLEVGHLVNHAWMVEGGAIGGFGGG